LSACLGIQHLATHIEFNNLGTHYVATKIPTHVNYMDPGLSRKHFSFAARWRARGRGGLGRACKHLCVRKKDLGSSNWHDLRYRLHWLWWQPTSRSWWLPQDLLTLQCRGELDLVVPGLHNKRSETRKLTQGYEWSLGGHGEVQRL